MLRAGELNRRITIRRAAPVRNAKGGYDQTWSTIARPWAKIDGLDGREAMMATALQGISSYRITIRYRDPASIKESDQLLLPGGVSANVKSVADPDGRQERLTILADTTSVQREL